MKNINWLNVWMNVRLLLMFAMVIFLFSFTSIRNENRKLKKVTVEFIGEERNFLNKKTVNKLLIENNTEVKTIRKVNLALNELEKSINHNNMVEHSEVFVTIDGVLKAVVKQKIPIARVFNKDSSFYIDYQGGKMPLSQIHTARVLLVSGEINSQNSKNLYELFRFIYKDDFLKKNIIGIQLYPNGAIKMMNRNYNYDIDFGSPINVEQKFNNYKAFFQKAVQDSTISKYKRITLRFTQQVVCTK
jgi:cell division protein FtsQ